MIFGAKEVLLIQKEKKLLDDLFKFSFHKVDGVQKILKESLGESCNEKSGWYRAGTEERLRNIITDVINKHISEERSKQKRTETEEVVFQILKSQHQNTFNSHKRTSKNTHISTRTTIHIHNLVY